LGIEIMPDYCDMAVERYEAFKKERDDLQRQGRLFEF